MYANGCLLAQFSGVNLVGSNFSGSGNTAGSLCRPDVIIAIVPHPLRTLWPADKIQKEITERVHTV